MDTGSPGPEPRDKSCGPMVQALHLLQEKWVLFIVWALLRGGKGFNELSREGASIINSTTLSQRLDLLESAGLVTRTVQSLMPPRTHYDLTPAGQALGAVLASIEQWAEAHLR